MKKKKQNVKVENKCVCGMNYGHTGKHAPKGVMK